MKGGEYSFRIAVTDFTLSCSNWKSMHHLISVGGFNLARANHNASQSDRRTENRAKGECITASVKRCIIVGSSFLVTASWCGLRLASEAEKADLMDRFKLPKELESSQSLSKKRTEDPGRWKREETYINIHRPKLENPFRSSSSGCYIKHHAKQHLT